jgi:hypothetical protein
MVVMFLWPIRLLFSIWLNATFQKLNSILLQSFSGIAINNGGLKQSDWRLATGNWRLAISGWQFATGCWF